MTDVKAPRPMVDVRAGNPGDLRRKASFRNLGLKVQGTDLATLANRCTDPNHGDLFREEVIKALQGSLNNSEDTRNSNYNFGTVPDHKQRFETMSPKYVDAITWMQTYDALPNDADRTTHWQNEITNNIAALTDQDPRTRVLNAMKYVHDKYPRAADLPNPGGTTRADRLQNVYTRSAIIDIDLTVFRTNAANPAAPAATGNFDITATELSQNPEKAIDQYERLFTNNIAKGLVELPVHANDRDVVIYAGRETFKEIFTWVRQQALTDAEKADIIQGIRDYVNSSITATTDDRITPPPHAKESMLGSPAQKFYLGGVLGVPANLNLIMNIWSAALNTHKFFYPGT